MGDVLMWTVVLVTIMSSLAVSTVTLLVISRLRDMGSIPGAAELAASRPTSGHPARTDLRALRDSERILRGVLRSETHLSSYRFGGDADSSCPDAYPRSAR
ncbi:hypothetical protein GCM10009619_22560 [Williamsia maris]